MGKENTNFSSRSSWPRFFTDREFRSSTCHGVYYELKPNISSRRSRLKASFFLSLFTSHYQLFDAFPFPPRTKKQKRGFLLFRGVVGTKTRWDRNDFIHTENFCSFDFGIVPRSFFFFLFLATGFYTGLFSVVITYLGNYPNVSSSRSIFVVRSRHAPCQLLITRLNENAINAIRRIGWGFARLASPLSGNDCTGRGTVKRGHESRCNASLSNYFYTSPIQCPKEKKTITFLHFRTSGIKKKVENCSTYRLSHLKFWSGSEKALC